MKHMYFLLIICVLICVTKITLSTDTVEPLEHNPYIDGTYFNNFEDHSNAENINQFNNQDNISQLIQKDMGVLSTLSTIKDDIDQTMRLAKISDSGYVDYDDDAYYNYVLDHGKEVSFKPLKQSEGKGRASSNSDDSNRLGYPYFQLTNSTVQTMYFPHGYMVVSGSAGENDNGDGNGFSLLGSSDIPRASTVRLPNSFIIMSIVAAVAGLAALNYFTLQNQLNNIDSTTSICQAARQVGDFNIPLVNGATAADLNRAIDAINSLPTVNCN